MFVTIRGRYKAGQVILAEQPADIAEAEVLVTFLGASAATKGQPMRLGQFAGERMSTEEDFRIAEWRGEADHGK